MVISNLIYLYSINSQEGLGKTPKGVKTWRGKKNPTLPIYKAELDMFIFITYIYRLIKIPYDVVIRNKIS